MADNQPPKPGTTTIKETHTTRVETDAAGPVPPLPGDALMIVDLGKRKKKAIKDLRRGRGKLLAEVQDVIEELKEAEPSRNTTPIIVIVEAKEEAGGLFDIFN